MRLESRLGFLCLTFGNGQIMLDYDRAEMSKPCLHRKLLLPPRIVPFALTLVLAPWGRADMHWTTNGTHTGVLVQSVPVGASTALDSRDIPGGRDFIGTFTLAYGLWSLGGEPIHEYIFTWGWHSPNLTLGRRSQRTITAADLEKYPELKKSFFALRPTLMTLAATMQFYDAAGNRFASARKLITPALIEQARAKDPFHAPGSPRWADFFKTDDPEMLSRDELDRRHKELFLKAARVELTEPRITSITWPEAAITRIVDEFCRREGMDAGSNTLTAEPSASQAQTNLTTILLLTSGPPTRVQTPLNPFEQAARPGQTTENPFERAARLQAEKSREKSSP